MEWLAGAVVAFGNFANTKVVPGVPQGTIIVCAWLAVGLFAAVRTTQARADAYRDRKATELARLQGTGTEAEVWVARGISRCLRGMVAAVYALFCFGVVVMFSNPTPPQPTPIERTPSSLLAAPLLIAVLLSLTYGADSIVQARRRWRTLYRKRLAGGAADESTPAVAVCEPGGTKPG